ncbi:MAG: tRNA (N(6)-L-threonylcarbamoyladenosine(37)-C(2))-methylthiotransferase MtaB [Clostridia bacterium]|nr:tRNA (N(6)-L-threonylcarbamoyladenosine(37)-C(2))-methylthiotransferase MtaB [Clostridia bacterium]
MRIAFATLGCKVNQFETQALELIAKEKGHVIVPFSEGADAFVINTCSVTAVSDKKSRQLIRKTIRANKDSVIAVCGCFSQANPDGAAAIEGVHVVSGTNDKRAFFDMIEKAVEDRQMQISVDKALARREFEILPAGGLSHHTRAMLKVQDGCVNFCTYCIIPYTRGPIRSMPFDLAVSEAKRLEREGYREIIITGIEISSYGVDLKPKREIGELIAEICKAVPNVRIRLGSLEPRTIDEGFCNLLKDFKNLCPQFHLSLQSGSDATLARMRRKYDTARYLKSVKLIRENFENCAITTDLIVGFPGETNEEFDETLEFIKKCDFSMMHIFPYSKREGTPAAKMSDQIEKSIKEERAAFASAVEMRMRYVFWEKQVGKACSVLFEEVCDGMWQGHSENYIPVRVRSERDLKNQVMNVEIKKVKDDYLMGVLI